ncbi:MAG TPA: GAF and ANTAR domain-containing protein, partial [Sporichthya sp.]|nr:GAF and ANTAR domain-containing protein [Sporichthya sp.]
PEIDEAQYREGRGPCLDAWRDNAVFRVPRVEDCEDKYPAFTAACQQHGVRSTLSLPMRSGEMALGAVNLYARAPEAFSDDDEALGRDLAVAGAAVLVNVSAYWSAFDLSAQLSQALDSRAVIEQAKGMLMAGTPGLTPDQAFDMLRSASQRENVKLRDIAKRIVERRGGNGREDEDTR